jgi:hypothetical protein
MTEQYIDADISITCGQILLVSTRSEMIETEHADRRREIVARATIGNPLY